MQQQQWDGRDRPLNKTARIQSVAARLGTFTIRELAEAVVEDGIFTEDEMQSFALRHVRYLCREAVKERDDQGLPFAGQLAARPEADESHEPVWAQRQLWGPEDYVRNIEVHVEQARANLDVAAKLGDECQKRFGINPYLRISGRQEAA